MRDFTSGNATKQILLFSIPMLVGNIFQQLYSMADAVVIGRFEGGTALAAVGVAMNVLQFLLATLIGLTTGASVVISQFYGAKQYDRLERTVSTSVVFLAVLSVVIAVLGTVFAVPLLWLLNADEEIIPDAALYLRILMAGMLFPVFYNMYTAYLRALGDSKGPLFILICCTVLNVGLDLLFVAQFKMGVLGVAVATVIAQAFSAGLCWFHTRRSAPLLHVKRLSFEPELFRSILRYGAPAAVQLSLVSFANLTITRLINSFGTAAMAGITAAAKIDQMTTMPISNVSMALSTFAGQNIGAGLEDRAKKGLRSALLLMLGFAVLISAIIIAFGQGIFSIFLSDGDANRSEILRVGISYLNIISVCYFFFAFLFGFNGFFRGTGDAVIAMVFPVTSLAIRTISAHMLVSFAGMGPEALAWSIPIGWGLTSLASWWYYRKGFWRGKSIVARKMKPAQ